LFNVILIFLDAILAHDNMTLLKVLTA